jgi:hypothetical protein
MEIDMYVLGLLKFRKGEIVFNERELDIMNKAVSQCLKGQKKVHPGTKLKRMGGWRVSTLNPRNLGRKVPGKVKISYAEFGYCHHRVIMHFKLGLKKSVRKSEKYPLFREAREELKKEADDILNNCVKEKINEIVRSEKQKNLEEREVSGEFIEKGEVKFIYTYPFIIMKRKRRKHRMVPFLEETSTLCFEMVEPSWLPPFRKNYLMKITIPSTTLYTQSDADESLLRDIINAIYQHCLYKKKEQDEKKKLIDYDKEPFENVVSENLLVELWGHFINTMGGRSADVRIVRITTTTRLIAFLALLVAIVTLLRSFM